MEINQKADYFGTYDIPEDLVSEIIVRLPVEIIVKFRYVSKSWCYLISSKQFAQYQLDFAKKKTDSVRIIAEKKANGQSQLKQYHLNVLLNKSDGTGNESDEFYFPLNNEACRFRFIGSCNGLCCALIANVRLFVWNPLTRVSRELPYHLGKGRRIFNYGFGFDGDDYKVFVMYLDSDNWEVAELYSLRTDSWKRVNTEMPVDMDNRYNTPGKFVNGKLYWITYSGERIFYFELGTELYGKIDPPPSTLEISPFRTECCSLLEVFEERLCLLSYESGWLDVWAWKDESWDKTIIWHSVPKHFAEPVWIIEDGECLIWMKNSSIPFLLYDPEKHTARSLKFMIHDTFSRTHVYVTSLVSPF